MQRQWINFLLILFSWSLSIHARAILRGSSNETLLVGQIIGPSDGVVRNLLGMMLSMNVFFNNTILHSSLIPITNSTFPFNYSIVLADRDFELENATNFYIVSMIWQPAYIHAENFNLSEDKVDTHNLEMRAIKFVIIRGEIVHDKHDQVYDLSGTQIKLELIEDGEKGHIIDQVDFRCSSNKYPCPFEYWFDTSRIKAKNKYRLEAILADHILPARNSTHQKHPTKTKSTHSTIIEINPTINTEINDYKIIVSDVQ